MNIFPILILGIILGVMAILIKREQEDQDFPDKEQGS